MHPAEELLSDLLIRLEELDDIFVAEAALIAGVRHYLTEGLEELRAGLAASPAPDATAVTLVVATLNPHEGVTTMSDTATTPTAISTDAFGSKITVTGQAGSTVGSLAKVTSPALTCSDPSSAFDFTADPSGLSATLVPLGGVDGVATVTFTGTDAAGNALSASVGISYTEPDATSVSLAVTSLAPATPVAEAAPAPVEAPVEATPAPDATPPAS